jgi:hypothetical protein
MIDRIRRALALISYKNPCCSGEELVHREIPHVQPQEHVILISAAGKKPIQKAVEEMLRVSDAVSWIFPTHAQYGEGNELQELSPAVARCLVKWRGN